MAGGTASVATTIITVPLDVISQRLMVQDGHINQYQYNSSFSIPFHSLLTNFRRNFLNLENGRTSRDLQRIRCYTVWFSSWKSENRITYAPSNACWWGTYSFLKNWLLDHTDVQPFVIQSISGVTAGCISAAIVNPLDVAKTRLQVLPNWKLIHNRYFNQTKKEIFLLFYID